MSLPSPAPMLLASARELPRGEGWAFEPKWDGFRCLAHLGADTRLVSRRGHDLLRHAPELSGLHRVVPLPVVLDGELVAVRSGRPSFDALHRRVFGPRRDQEVGVAMVVFDLLVLGGSDLTSLPYGRRRGILENLGVGGPGMALTPAWPAPDGPALFAATRELGMEGVVAKRLGSPYRPGVRSPDWVKVKHWRVEEFAVGGWLPDREGGLRAILLGRPVRGGLVYAGAVEFGFSRTDLRAELQALAAEGQAPKGAPSTARPVRPVLTARVRYQSLTEDGRVRGATVVGFHPV